MSGDEEGRQVPVPFKSPGGAFGSDKNSRDLDDAIVGEFHENNSVGADLLAETSLPIGSAEGLDVAPLGFILRFELINGPIDPLPHIAGQSRSLLLGLAG